MADILGTWLACKRSHLALGIRVCLQWPEPATEQFFEPEKRLKLESMNDWLWKHEHCKADSISDKSTQQSAEVSEPPATRANELKILFTGVFCKDELDLSLYRRLSLEQRQATLLILGKRYNKPLIDQLEQKEVSTTSIQTFQYMKLKRMDHCEKTVVSMQLSILRDRFKLERYCSSRPKELHKDINTALFKEYFANWLNPEALVEMSRPLRCDSPSEGSEWLPRQSALFCMKKGLTKFWFKAVSTKFIDAVQAVDLAAVQSYCEERYPLKLDKIFGSDLETPDNYFLDLSRRIANNKFKLPLTKRELELCYTKAQNKISMLRKATEEQEMNEFKAYFGDASFKQEYENWTTRRCLHKQITSQAVIYP